MRDGSPAHHVNQARFRPIEPERRAALHMRSREQPGGNIRLSRDALDSDDGSYPCIIDGPNPDAESIALRAGYTNARA